MRDSMMLVLKVCCNLIKSVVPDTGGHATSVCALFIFVSSWRCLNRTVTFDYPS